MFAQQTPRRICIRDNCCGPEVAGRRLCCIRQTDTSARADRLQNCIVVADSGSRAGVSYQSNGADRTGAQSVAGRPSRTLANRISLLSPTQLDDNERSSTRPSNGSGSSKSATVAWDANGHRRHQNQHSRTPLQAAPSPWQRPATAPTNRAATLKHLPSITRGPSNGLMDKSGNTTATFAHVT